MKIIKTFILIAFIGHSKSKAQSFEIDPYSLDTINQVDLKGNKQGKWVLSGKHFKNSCFNNEQLAESGNYSNNIKNGIWISWFCNGNLKNKITYIKGAPNGKVEIYDKDGYTQETGTWNENHWINDYYQFYPNGNVKYHFFYNHLGQRIGVQKYFYENGKLMKEINIIDGLEEGVHKEYSKEGVLISEKHYRRGIIVKESESAEITKKSKSENL